MEMGTLIFDIDGTICSQEKDYSKASPNYEVIDKLNQKYDEGYKIVLFTARGTETDRDWREITLKQLDTWGVKYHSLKFGKPAGLLYIDDKGINVNNWEPNIEATAVVNKVWGKEYLLSKTNSYAFKRLEIYENNCISNQYHNFKEETWHIVEGTGIAFINHKQINIKPGVTIHIPPGIVHQVLATSNKLVIIEASTTELEDVVRLNREFAYVYNR